MTPAETIARIVRAYPGRVQDVADESGISRARLCSYIADDPTRAGYAPPTAETAAKVCAAVRTLLTAALASIPD